MSGSARKTIAAVLSVMAAAGVAALVGAPSWGWLPGDAGVRWTIATAAGAVVAAAVLYALTGWASPGTPPASPRPGRKVRQTADGRGNSVIEQAAGRPGARPDEVDQRAKAQDHARVRQTADEDQP